MAFSLLGTFASACTTFPVPPSVVVRFSLSAASSRYICFFIGSYHCTTHRIFVSWGLHLHTVVHPSQAQVPFISGALSFSLSLSLLVDTTLDIPHGCMHLNRHTIQSIARLHKAPKKESAHPCKCTRKCTLSAPEVISEQKKPHTSHLQHTKYRHESQYYEKSNQNTQPRIGTEHRFSNCCCIAPPSAQCTVDSKFFCEHHQHALDHDVFK